METWNGTWFPYQGSVIVCSNNDKYISLSINFNDIMLSFVLDSATGIDIASSGGLMPYVIIAGIGVAIGIFIGLNINNNKHSQASPKANSSSKPKIDAREIKSSPAPSAMIRLKRASSGTHYIQTLVVNNSAFLYKIDRRGQQMFDGQYVKEGDLITEIQYSDYGYHHVGEAFPFRALSSGYLFNNPYLASECGKSEREICYLYDSIDDLLKDQYPIRYKIIIDDFTKEKTFSWGNSVINRERTLWQVSNYCLGLGFHYHDKKPCLLIYNYGSLKSMQILFSNDTIITIPLEKANISRIGEEPIFDFYCALPLTKSLYDTFIRDDIKVVRIEDKYDKKRDYRVDEPRHTIDAIVFKHLAEVFISSFEEYGADWVSEEESVMNQSIAE